MEGQARGAARGALVALDGGRVLARDADELLEARLRPGEKPKPKPSASNPAAAPGDPQALPRATTAASGDRAAGGARRGARRGAVVGAVGAHDVELLKAEVVLHRPQGLHGAPDADEEEPLDPARLHLWVAGWRRRGRRRRGHSLRGVRSASAGV